MDKHHFIVIGNGPAGNHAALTLRQHLPDARITVISKEACGCYLPHLLPKVISGAINEDQITVFSPSSYKEKNIKFRSGQEVVGIDLHKKTILMDHKEIIPFDGLVIAVGGKPRIPEHLEIFKERMLILKTVKHAEYWIKRLAKASSVLLIGGDLTSLAFAKELLSMNKKIYFLLNEDAFWPLRCNMRLLDEVTRTLLDKGIHVLTQSEVKSLSVQEDESIELGTDHDRICVDVVGAFFGLVPDIRFAVGSGLRIDRGIIVDEFLHTGFDGVYATGDCAQIFHPEIRDYWVSIGYENAVTLGRIAALNLAGAHIKTDVDKESILDVQGVNVNTSWWMEF